jgi:hypothetical protein
MKTKKLSHIVFGLAMIAALSLAAIPTVPAHAMSDTAAQQSAIVAAADGSSSTLTAGAVVCRSWTVWRNGHRVTVRVCHRVHDRDKDK